MSEDQAEKVISLSDRRVDRTFPRRLFSCGACDYRMFKMSETDNEVMVECANCETIVNIESILNPKD